MASPVQQRKALTPREAADQVGMGESRFRMLYQTGQIRVIRVGRRVIVPVAELDRWLAGEQSHANAAGAPR